MVAGRWEVGVMQGRWGEGVRYDRVGNEGNASSSGIAVGAGEEFLKDHEGLVNKIYPTSSWLAKIIFDRQEGDFGTFAIYLLICLFIFEKWGGGLV